MARQYKTGLIITGDASGGIKAIQATEKELDQLNQGFDRGGKRARQFGQDADRAGRQLDGVTDSAGETSRELDVLRGAAVSVGAALAGAFAVNNLAAQADMIRNTDALAQSLQVGTRTLQQWQFAGQSVGLEADKIGDIFKDVSDKVGDFAATGGGEAADLFENLSLNIRELQSLSPDQQILRIAEAIGEVEDPSQRSFYFESLADEMVRLQPLLADGAEGLREAAETADALGVAMDDIEVQRAVEAAESMDRLQGVAQGLANTLIADLGPGLAGATQNVIEFVDAMGGADEIAEQLLVVGGSLAVLVGGRLVKAYAAHATSVFQSIAAERQMQTAAAATAQAELMAAQNAQRRAAAEQYSAKRLLGRAQAEARATRGTDAHTAALERLNQRRRAAVAASAKHRTAINTTTAAQQRYTASARVAASATRGLSGALALVGGPLGLLVGAGGLLYMFRDELGLTQRRIGLTEDELKSFRDELGEMSEQDLGQSLASLNASLEEATLKAAAAREEVAKLRTEDDGYSVTGVGNLSEQVAGINALAEAQEKLRGIEQKRNESRIELWGRWSDAVVNGTAATDENSDANDHNTETLESQAEAADELTKQLEQQASAAQSLVDELYPLQAAQREYAEDKAALVQYALQENKGNEWLEESMRRLEGSYRSNQTAAEAYGLEVDNLADRTDPMADAFQEASRRIDETFADAFQGAFDSFDDFASQLEDAFKRLLAELAYQATLRPIVVEFTGQMQDMIGGGGGQQGGMFGGGQGGGSDVGTLIKGGKWAYDRFFGGAAAGASGTAAVGYGGSGWASSVGANTYGGWAGNASGAASASGGSLAGSAMSGLYTAGAGFAGGWAGSEVGGMVSDKQANSNIGQSAGTAVGAYVGSVFPGIGTAIGAAVGGFLGGLGDTLFGSGGSDLDIAMMRRESKNSGRSWDHGIVAEGGLGAVGFDDDGSHEVADLWDIDEAKKLVEGIAQLDTAVASLAGNRGELDAMRDAVLASNRHGIRGHYGETSNPGDVVGRLTSRYDQALEQIGGTFGEFVRGIDGGIEEVVQRGLAAKEAFGVLSAAATQLHLNLDTTQASAYEAAASLAEMVGGTQNLASLQQNYYQTMFSEEEQLGRLRADLQAEFRALGMTLPESERGFRALVRAQDLNTQAGQKNYAQLLQLVDGFKQLQNAMGETSDTVEDTLASAREAVSEGEKAVRQAWQAFDSQSSSQRITLLEMMGDQERILAIQREEELAAMDEALRPIQDRIWALQDEAEAQTAAAQAGQQYAQALASAQDWLGSTLGSISGWIDRNQATDAGLGTPADQLAAAGEAYREQLAAARNGDRTALQNITQYAERFIAAQQGWSASGVDTTTLIDRIEQQLGELPDQLSAEEYLAEEVRQALQDAVDQLPGGIAAALSPMFDSIDLNADELIDYDEFGRQFAGMASDAELRRIFDQLDTNGDGTISRLEALKRSGEGTEGNTGSIEERAAEQLDRLTSLMESTRDSVDQLGLLQDGIAGVNTAVETLNESLTALRQLETYSQMQDSAQWMAEEMAKSESIIASARGELNSDQIRVYDKFVRGNASQGPTSAMDQDDWERIQANLSANDNLSAAAKQYILHTAATMLREGRLAEWERIVAGQEYTPDSLNVEQFATGGVFTNAIVDRPTRFDMGEMGEAGPEAIMPLHRGPGGSLGVRAELPPTPALPLLGQGDVVEALNDLRRENQRLRQDLNQVLGRIEQHGAAGVRVQQAGLQRVANNTARTAETTERMDDRQRLETAR